LQSQLSASCCLHSQILLNSGARPVRFKFEKSHLNVTSIGIHSFWKVSILMTIYVSGYGKYNVLNGIMSYVWQVENVSLSPVQACQFALRSTATCTLSRALVLGWCMQMCAWELMPSLLTLMGRWALVNGWKFFDEVVE
jgi:hypothetical protein